MPETFTFNELSNTSQATALTTAWQSFISSPEEQDFVFSYIKSQLSPIIEIAGFKTPTTRFGLDLDPWLEEIPCFTAELLGGKPHFVAPDHNKYRHLIEVHLDPAPLKPIWQDCQEALEAGVPVEDMEWTIFPSLYDSEYLIKLEHLAIPVEWAFSWIKSDRLFEYLIDQYERYLESHAFGRASYALHSYFDTYIKLFSQACQDADARFTKDGKQVSPTPIVIEQLSENIKV